MFFEVLGVVLHDGGLDAVLERLGTLARDHRPSIVVIDSFKAFNAFADDDGSYRRFLHSIAGMLTATAVSAFFLGEYIDTEIGAARPTSYDIDQIRMPTGIAALDDLVHDGYWRGASTLVAGPTGSGKTPSTAS